MVNKRDDSRFWRKWRENGAVGDINGSAAGAAYAFFDSSASPKDIAELAVTEARRIAKRKPKTLLEIDLTEVKDIKEEQNPELYDFLQRGSIYPIFPSSCKNQMKDAKPVRLADLKYAISVKRHRSTDERAANYLGNVMSDVYQQFERDKPFNSAVVYRNPQDGYLDFKRD